MYHKSKTDPWKVTLVDTGDETMTGGRIEKIKNYLGNDETFCMTYGDGLADINIKDLIAYHHNHKCQATITASIAPGRFGSLLLDEDSSVNEMEKSFTQEAIETPQEQIVEESIEEDISNNLKEFGVDSDAPDLFSSETENSSSDDLISSNDEEDDDLEIPAFLRRQKN